MSLLLWLLVIILIVVGVVRLLQRDFLWGVVLIFVGLIVASASGVGVF